MVLHTETAKRNDGKVVVWQLSGEIQIPKTIIQIEFGKCVLKIFIFPKWKEGARVKLF